MVNFKIKIAEIVLEINAFNEITKKYCRDFLSDEEPDYIITLTEEDLRNEVTESNNGHVYVNEEISALYRKIADLLIENDIIVFHGSSFKVKDSGFIVTARSGVGKSTHVKLLSEYLGNDFEYINDDKPLLKVKDELVLYSNPWNGKERRGNNTSASLKAVIFLNRGDNTYKKLDNKEEVYFKLLSQIYLPRDKAKREKALKLIDILLKRLNFYEINVNMDISSAEMTSERIIKNEIK
ncbi:MAG: hypothetical protein J6T25_00840 [Bacilli bacterium]|nr:hypothetical protein [Bacilli bacterium]